MATIKVGINENSTMKVVDGVLVIEGALGVSLEVVNDKVLFDGNDITFGGDSATLTGVSEK